MKLDYIECGDNVTLMKKLPDECIDLTVTSPPYDNLRTYKGFTWDFESVAKELYRITKQGGVVVWVVADATVDGSETGTSFRQALYFKEVGFNLHDTMIWEKPNPMPRDTRIPRYWQSFEYVFILSKGAPQHFNFIREQSKHHGEKRKCYTRNSDGSMRTDRKEKTINHLVLLTKPKGNIWRYTTVTNKLHPAPFPEQLAQDHIISWSNKGDTVLDPFSGSGTTAKMAAILNRHYIGFDIAEEYCEIARKRVEDATAQIRLDI